MSKPTKESQYANQKRWVGRGAAADGVRMRGEKMDALQNLIDELRGMELLQKVDRLNEIRMALHEVSPFATEPVDCVLWVRNEMVEANDYNPNSVAPPEMELLRLSIEADGYTQPIVATSAEDGFTVIDGFHRNRVGKECADVAKRVHGYLPLAMIQASRDAREDRMAATIRHNRARGKHRVESMSEIVIELKRRNWSDDKISKQLGMDADEVLRLTQIAGLAEAFANCEFSRAWEAEPSEYADDHEIIDEN